MTVGIVLILNIAWEHFNLRKRYCKVIIFNFVEQVLLSEGKKLVIAFSCCICIAQFFIRKALIQDRVGGLVVVIKNASGFVQSDRGRKIMSGSSLFVAGFFISDSKIVISNIILYIRKFPFAKVLWISFGCFQ